MATKESGAAKNGRADSEKTVPRSATFFDRGISTDVEFANASIAVAGDLVSGSISPSIGNAVCANLRNVLKVVELKHKFGSPVAGKPGIKSLRLNASA